MIGLKRGIKMGSDVLIEFDMRVKTGEREDDDLELVDGALVCSEPPYIPWDPGKQQVIG